MIWNKLYSWIAGAALVVAALLGIRRAGTMAERERQEAQRAAEMAEAQADRIDKMRRANEIKNGVSAAAGGDVRERLRKYYRD